MDLQLTSFLFGQDKPCSREVSLGGLELLLFDGLDDVDCSIFPLECIRTGRKGLITRRARSNYPIFTLEANITVVKPLSLVRVCSSKTELSLSSSSSTFSRESPISEITKEFIVKHSRSFIGDGFYSSSVIVTRGNILGAVAVDSCCNRLHVACDSSTDISAEELALCIRSAMSNGSNGSDNDVYTVLISAGDYFVYESLSYLRFEQVEEYDIVTFCACDAGSLTDDTDTEFPSGEDGGCLDVFLLAGQSNMAGRGLLSTFVQEYDSYRDIHSDMQTLNDYLNENGELMERYSTKIHKFDISMSRWVNGADIFNLHKYVDILKKVGIGPGVIFACHRLSDTSAETTTRIGLVPSASGGTYLEEWNSAYIAIHGNPLTTPMNVPTIESWRIGRPVCDQNGDLIFPDNSRYARGCINLCSGSMRSLYYALKQTSSFTKVRLAGLLWYQGENDACLMKSYSETYGARFDLFMNDISRMFNILLKRVQIHRDVEIPNSTIPCLTVAITTTRHEQCPHKDIINSHQLQRRLSAYRSSGTDNACILMTEVVDAFGLSLQQDNIHIDIPSIFRLGVSFSKTYAALVKRISNSADYIPSQVSFPWYTPALFVVPVKAIQANELYQKTKNRVIEELDDPHANDSVFVSTALQQSFSSYVRTKASSLPILRTGLKAKNFTYGELEFLEFYRVLKLANISPLSSFIDLGCGSGVLLAAAMMGNFQFNRILGIEMNHSKVTECRLVVSQLSVNFPEVGFEVIEGNFLEISWVDFDVVYTCSTCFASDQMDKLLYLFNHLRVGAKIILVDKQIKIDGADSSLSAFKQISSCQCRTSWGTADIFVYVKTK